MKTLIVATDLSERSERAVERALSLAEVHDATCHVVSVVDDALPLDISDKMAASIKERLTEMAAAHAFGARTEITVLRGDVSEMLIRFAMMQEADLVVLGMHRPRTFLDGLRETTMTRVVAASPAPVLLVKNDPGMPYRKALVPVSFSASCAAAVRAVQRLAPKASLVAFNALHVPFRSLTGSGESQMATAVRQEAEAVRNAWLIETGLEAKLDAPEIIEGAVRMVMDEMLALEQADLLAIGAHTRSGLSVHSLGSFASELVRDPPVDLLVSPPPRV